MATPKNVILIEDEDDSGEVQHLRTIPTKVSSTWPVQSQQASPTSPFPSNVKRSPRAAIDSANFRRPEKPLPCERSRLRRQPPAGQVSSACDLAHSTWSFPTTLSGLNAESRDQSGGMGKQIDSREEQSQAKSAPRAKLMDAICIDDESDSDIEELIPRCPNKAAIRGSSIQLVGHGKQQPSHDSLEDFRRAAEILDEEDFGDYDTPEGPKTTKKSMRNSLKMNGFSIVVDLEEWEEQIQLESPAEYQVPAQSRAVSGRSATHYSRKSPIAHPFVRCERAEFNGKQLMAGKFIETLDGDFYRITDVFQNPNNGEIALCGLLLQRCKYLNGLLPPKLNELCWMVELEADEGRSPLEQSVVKIEPSHIKGLKRVNFTNSPYPEGNLKVDGIYYSTWEEKEQTGILVTRWRSTTIFSGAIDLFHNRPSEKVIQRLQATDLEKISLAGSAMSDKMLRSNYRGYTVPGGAYRSSKTPTIGKKIIRIDDIVSSLSKLGSQTSSSIASAGWKRKRSDMGPGKQHGVIHITEDNDDIVDLEDQTEAVRREMSVTSIAENEVEFIASLWSDEDNASNQTWSGIKERQNCPLGKPKSSLSSGLGSGRLPRSSASGPKPMSRAKGQKYTYGDGFCGAGGATRGAVMAGLEPKWGFDFSKPACATWHQNFPRALIYNMWADQFIALGDDVKVDILHLSPPCQYFSPAHTVDGKDDEMNSASLFACEYLLDRVLPRVVTLEQTFGICHAKFRPFFNSLILMFTSKGFSIRWKICDFQNWGLPQRRQRLVIIASCPGEVLPEFPPFTHAEHPSSSGIKKWNSVDDILNGIPTNAPDHDIISAMQKPLNLPPWDSTSIAPRCITTHGGHNYHPSGARRFTNREFAALQGFPLEHKFSETYVKKQIGNAVPPSIAKVLLTAVKKALEKADGIKEESIVID